MNKLDNKARRRIVNLLITTSIYNLFFLKNFYIENNT